MHGASRHEEHCTKVVQSNPAAAVPVPHLALASVGGHPEAVLQFTRPPRCVLQVCCPSKLPAAACRRPQKANEPIVTIRPVRKPQIGSSRGLTSSSASRPPRGDAVSNKMRTAGCVSCRAPKHMLFKNNVQCCGWGGTSKGQGGAIHEIWTSKSTTRTQLLHCSRSCEHRRVTL